MNKLKVIKITTSLIFFLLILTAFTFLIIDLMEPIKEAILVKNFDPVIEEFKRFGFWAPVIIGLAQAMQILITFFPAQPIQIIAGLTLGHTMGFIASISGIIVGNFTIYILVRKLGTNFLLLFKEKTKHKIDDLQPKTTSKRTLIVIMLMYLFPIVPYGIIAFMAANTKIRFLRYMLLTTIGTLPSLIACLWIGNLIIDERWKLVLTILLILIIITLFLTKYAKRIFDYIENNPKYDMAHFQSHIRKPRTLLYALIVYIIKIFFFTKLNVKTYNTKIKKTKRPYVVIFNHPSKLDFMYAYVPMFPNKVSSVTAYYYFCNYLLGRLLHNVGAFPKFLFQPDISSMKNIKKVIKWGGVLGLSPEGRLSADGTMEAINPATGKLLKNLCSPIILAKISGAYLAFPKWARNMRKGKVEIYFEEILSREDLEKLSVEEIDKILAEKLYYDDFAWQEKNKIYYKGDKFAEGLEHMLYICPVCKSEFTYTSKDDILHCSCCNTNIKLNHYYQFESDNKLIPKNIRDWYDYQKEVETKNIQDPNYQLQSNVTVKLPDPRGKGFVVVGKGVAKLNHQGVTYVGTINEEHKEYEFKIQNLPAIPFGPNEDFEIYHHNTLYYFIPENIRECVKWSVVGELIHEKYMKENNQQ